MKTSPDPTTKPPAAPQILEELVRRAESARASDVHLQMTGKSASVSFRLDGVMTPAAPLAEDVAERVFGRIKYLARLKTYQESMPQDGRIDKGELQTQHDVRVATYPTVTGEKIVLRLFNESAARGLAELGLSGAVRTELERCLRQPSGLILLTGPAGSGKTTTIHACLNFLAALGGRHIITVEDPVEQILPGIMQTEVCEERGLTFAKAARHLLRQDPQVLAIGEIRDEETANIVVRAALTGHLVISTLHAGSCRGVFERLLLMCPDRFSTVAAVELILNQRLLRKLCATCGGAGCAVCLQTGYQGRVPVVEWFHVNDAARQRLREEGAAAIQPAQSLEEAANELVKAGVTNPRECQRTLGR
jgi:type II secretory ATPase GspE/PulE/Tfp pilus assembly ATPase PilB-like protein